MKKIFITFSLLILCLLFFGCVDKKSSDLNLINSETDSKPNISNKVPAAPAVTCEVSANILSIEKKDRNSTKDVQMNFSYYVLKLKVFDINLYANTGHGSCDFNYAKELETKGVQIGSSSFEKNPLSEGQIFKGIIHWGGDEFYHGYLVLDYNKVI